MTMTTYSSPGQRIGVIKASIWKHAVARQILEGSGEIWKQPVNMGDTARFRQVVPFGATAAAPNTFTLTAASHLVQEGFTPNVDTLVVVDTDVVVQEYGCLYGYTKKQAVLGEDPMPDWMEEQIGERLGDVREKVYLGALSACTNRFYSGGTTRATVDETVTLNLIDRVERNLSGNRAKFVREVLKPSGNIGTSAVEASYIAYGHTDLKADIKKIPGFIAVKDYGEQSKVHAMEVGAVGATRFVLSAEMPKVIDSGAAIAGTTNYSTTGTSADVYILYVIAKDAWGHCAFRGLDAIDFSHIPWNREDKSDPTKQRGYVSGSFYDCAVVSNHGWIAACEVAISALT